MKRSITLTSERIEAELKEAQRLEAEISKIDTGNPKPYMTTSQKDWHIVSRTILGLLPLIFQKPYEIENGEVKVLRSDTKGNEINAKFPAFLKDHDDTAIKVVLTLLTQSSGKPLNGVVTYNIDDLLDESNYKKRGGDFYHKPKNAKMVWDVIKYLHHLTVTAVVVRKHKTRTKRGTAKYREATFLKFFDVDRVQFYGGKSLTGITDPTDIDETPKVIGLRWNQVIASDTTEMPVYLLSDGGETEKHEFQPNFAWYKKSQEYKAGGDSWYAGLVELATPRKNEPTNVVMSFSETLRLMRLTDVAHTNYSEAKKRALDIISYEIEVNKRIVNFGFHAKGQAHVWRSSGNWNKMLRKLKIDSTVETLLATPDDID